MPEVMKVKPLQSYELNHLGFDAQLKIVVSSNFIAVRTLS